MPVLDDCATDVAIRHMEPVDLPRCRELWNIVVRDGVAFPQTDELDDAEAAEFFGSQSATRVAELTGEDGKSQVVGLYILHPNNVGRCGHISNASYAVDPEMRGRHIGEALVRDSLDAARSLGFRILQFNAVVASNASARHLYEKIGFTPLGTIPGGFRLDDGTYEDIVPYIYNLTVE
ncbi:MAG: GNAT family N-acetyltransferase [Coriobacteriales bacterium]|jgi:ribosomal protein S18 acetylase RimI-like enzyme